MEKAQAIIYRFDQMPRRLPKHMDRLNQAGQRLTAIVDGCGTGKAADLVPLLFDCDQFIGFNHYPAATAQSSVGRFKVADEQLTTAKSLSEMITPAGSQIDESQ